MPCQDDGPYYSRDLYQELHEKEKYAHLQTKNRLDYVTELLCELCGNLERENQFAKYDKTRLATWWKMHKKVDLKRIANEKIQAAKLTAIKQILTQEEREALLTEEERKILGV